MTRSDRKTTARPPSPPPRPPGAPKTPPEGPHADPALIDDAKTPGSGMFPEPGKKRSDAPSG